MKSPTATVLYVLACIAACALVVACASQAQFDAGHELSAAMVAATDAAGPGGATVTPEEEAHIGDLYGRLRDAEGVDWSQVGAGVLGSLGVLFPALRLIPNRWILGGAPDADVKRAAGLPA